MYITLETRPKKILEMWEDPQAYYKILSDQEQVLRAVAMGKIRMRLPQILILAHLVRRH